MKKLIPILLILCLLVACAPAAPQPYDGPAKELLDLPSYAETAQELPGGTALTDMACVAGGGLYYLASVPEGDGLALQLYRTDLATGETRMLRTCEDGHEQEASYTVTAILPGAGDGVWLMETVTRYIFDLPRNFDENTMDKWDYYQYRGNAMTFRHVTSDGAVAQAFTLDGLMSAFSCAAWHGGSLFCATESTLMQLSPTGGMEKTAAMPGYIEALASSPEGLMVLCEGQTGSVLYLLQEDLTPSQGSPLPTAIPHPMPAADGSILFTRQGNLFSWNPALAQGQKLLDWQFLGRNRAKAAWVCRQEDGTLLALYQQEPGESAQLLTLTPAQPQEQEGTELILAGVAVGENLMDLVLQFNSRRNGGYVRVADYAEFEALGQKGTDRLRLDLAGGKTPDLLCSTDPALPLAKLAPGMLHDLSTYMERDTALIGQGLMDSVFAALKARDGGLYAVTPSFRLSTAVALGSTVLPVPMSAQRAALLSESLTSDGHSPMEPYTSGEAVLAGHLSRRALAHTHGEGFRLDAEVLRQGLLLARLHPTSQQVADAHGLAPQWARVRQGHQLYLSGSYSSFDHLAYDLNAVGEDAVLCGWADVPGGHVLEVSEEWGMLRSCRDRDLGWVFLRQLLLDETQTSMALSGLPTNRTAFHRAGRSAMQGGGTVTHTLGKEQVEFSENLTEAQYAAIEEAALKAVTLSAPVESGLVDAVCRACADYLAGHATEDQAITAAQIAAETYPE